jgi:hypothetical protein
MLPGPEWFGQHIPRHPCFLVLFRGSIFLFRFKAISALLRWNEGDLHVPIVVFGIALFSKRSGEHGSRPAAGSGKAFNHFRPAIAGGCSRGMG